MCEIDDCTGDCGGDCCESVDCSPDGCSVDGCDCCGPDDVVGCCCNATSCCALVSCDVCDACSNRSDAKERLAPRDGLGYASVSDKTPPTSASVYVTAVPVAMPVAPVDSVKSI